MEIEPNTLEMTLSLTPEQWIDLIHTICVGIQISPILSESEDDKLEIAIMLSNYANEIMEQCDENN